MIDIDNEPLKVVALVKFNKGIAIVFNRMPNYKYTRDGDLLWAKDGPFYSCYKYHRPSKAFQAFGGREFNLEMVDGSITKCTGQWWDEGLSDLSEKLGLPLTHITISTVERLINCYVFSGTSGNSSDIEKLISEYDGITYPYWDYEKVIKFDCMRNRLLRKQWKLEKDKQSLIAEAKAKHARLAQPDCRMSEIKRDVAP